jgi:2-oxoisovalerate dehydrogenase E1 component subunit alpha
MIVCILQTHEMEYNMKTIAEFSIKYLEFLDANGQITQELPAFAKDPQTLHSLYRWMVLTRLGDAKAVAMQRTGKMGTYASSLGQEAVSVGMGHALKAEDVFVPYYRDQGAFLMRGIKFSSIYAYWGGDERGNSESFPPEDFPICVPIGTQYLHAAGVAYAIKFRKQPRAVLTICGDGGTSEGDFYEGLNFAGAFQLPIVFVINNNQWAISEPRIKQTHTQTLAQKAIAAGFEGLQIDGNDVIAVSQSVSDALDKARQGSGPTLIEAVTYRLCDHTTADDAKRYIKKEDLENAWKLEPISRLKKYLESQDLWSSAQEEQLQAECTQEIAAAAEEYLNMPAQPNTAIIDYLYEKLPIAYIQQRKEIAKL